MFHLSVQQTTDASKHVPDVVFSMSARLPRLCVTVCGWSWGFGTKWLRISTGICIQYSR